MKNFLIIVSLILILTGCATTNNNMSVTTGGGSTISKPSLSWPQRLAQMSAIHHWTAEGNLAARSSQKGVNASFNWAQLRDAYSLQIFGPFGSYRTLLTGNSAGVTMQSGEKTFTAPNAEILTQRQLGLRLPVANLYYWMRGIPVPHSPSQRTLDAKNHLVQLNQAGWQLNYLSYVTVNGIDIPDRIVLTNPQWQVRILVTNWQL